MKPGLKPNYISASLMLLLGLGSLVKAGTGLFGTPELTSPVTSSPSLLLLFISGVLTTAGSIGMLMRRPSGFWAAGIGMAILACITLIAFIPDQSSRLLIRFVIYAYLSFETLRAVWQYSGMSETLRNPPGALHPSTPPAIPRGQNRTSSPRFPVKNLNHLDAGDFAPISDEEMRRRAKKTDRSLLFRFGLRSQIPPVSDERTLLIDKALVAHGLMTPERLTEIHETGETYIKLRPTIQGAYVVEQLAANRAVAEDAAVRAAAREAKRAESAARKEQHARDVATRKATDIVFLGRGVSGGLSDRRANVEKLASLGLPVLTHPAEIAKALGCSIPRLRWLAFHSEASSVSHYVRFTIAKKSGGTRELAAPHQDTAAAQAWILQNILECLTMRDCAHGFIKGRNIMSNAVPHVRRDAVVNADLKDFFPCITFPRVKGIFEGLGYSPAIATILALLCTESPRRTLVYAGRELHVATGPRALPQGACTSPALSNLAARKLDARLEGLARKTGWTYTRYADDLTFSANGETTQHCGGLLGAVRRFCGEENFTVNEKKTRVQRQNTQQTVTGIVVNHRPNVPRDVYRRVRAILHQAKTTGLAAQNREDHPNFPLYVRGMMAWVHMANPERGKKLRKAWDELS